MNDFLKFIKTIYNFNDDFDKVFELEGLSNTHESLLREFQKMENDKLAKSINDDLSNKNLTIEDLLILYGTQLFEKDYFKKYVLDYNPQTDVFIFRDPIPLKEDCFKYQNFKGEIKEIWNGIK
jgi:hypothetical protein